MERTLPTGPVNLTERRLPWAFGQASLLARAFGSGRGLFIALASAAVIPVLIFGGWVAYVTADQQRAAARQAATDTVARVAERLEAEIVQEIEVAETLTMSHSLDAPDLERFYREAKRVASARPLWETVRLASPDGRQLINVDDDFGETLGTVVDPESFDRVVRTKTTVVGGVGHPDPSSGKRLVSVGLPVLREGELKYALTIALLPDEISDALRGAGAPRGWTGSVVDASGNVLAHTVAENFQAGEPAGAAVREAVGRAPAGAYRGRTADGVDVETNYRTLGSLGGWSIHFSIPIRELDGPVARSLAILLGGAGTSMVLAIALGLFVAREVSFQRREEARRSAGRLQASEERATLSIEAAELGTWRWDLQEGEITGSERFESLLGLPPSSTSAWTEGEFLARLQPGDALALKDAAARCISGGRPIEAELRVAGGSEHWVRAAGNVEPGFGHAPRVIHGVLADIDVRKRAEEERTLLLRQLATAHESEQRRIARELHDQVGQTMTGLSIGLKTLEEELGARAIDAAQEKLSWLRKLAGEIGRDIHRAATDLRSTALDDLGLHQALRPFLAEWSRRYGVGVDYQVVGGEERLPPETETVVYRVIQEALNNVLKHAGAKNVSVILERKPGHFAVVIEDDGAGFDPERVGPVQPGASGLGIPGMRERLAMVGGSLELESAPGAGTTLFIQVPITSPAAKSGSQA